MCIIGFMRSDNLKDFDMLKLENQLCFPLYVCSKEIIKKYKPFLDEIDLTYTQYITMMVLWENREITVKELGKYLFLDSGTLTPLLKKLEVKGYIKRCRAVNDERNLIVSVTPCGMELRNKAKEVPIKLSQCINLDEQDAKELYRILYKLLGSFDDILI